MEHLKGMQMKRDLRQRMQRVKDSVLKTPKQEGIESDSDNYGDDNQNSPKKAKEKKGKPSQDESVESSQKIKE